MSINERDIQSEINRAGRRLKEEEARQYRSEPYRYSYQTQGKTQNNNRQGNQQTYRTTNNSQQRNQQTYKTTNNNQQRKQNSRRVVDQSNETDINDLFSFMGAFWFRSAVLSIAIYLALQFLSSLDDNDFVINRESKVGTATFTSGEYNDDIDSNLTVLHALNDDFDSNLTVLRAIDNNNQLSPEEKNIIYSFQDMIMENPYLDREKAEESLSSLKVKYVQRDSKYSNSTLGVYDYKTNSVRMFTNKNKTPKRALAHEMMHSIYYNEKTAKLPSFLLEGMTQLLVDEYSSDVPCYEESTYPFEVTTVKILCEMLGKDELLRAYSTGDMTHLKEKLSLSMGRKATDAFIANLDSIFKDYEKGKCVDQNRLSNVINYIDMYYIKNEISNTEKLDAYNYYRGIMVNLSDDQPRISLNLYLSENGVYVKPYFSRKLLEKYVGPYFEDYSTTAYIRNRREAKEYIKY